MTLINALPFDGIEISSETWRKFQSQVLMPMRVTPNDDGIYYSPSNNQFKVAKVNATTVSVQPGSGMAIGLPFWSESVVNLTVAAAHATYTRYDYVVMRANFIDKEARLTVLQGTPAASPSWPSLDKSAAPYYDVPLALLTITPGTGVNVVNDHREFIHGAPGVQRMVRNNSGSTMYPGTIVVWDQFSPINVLTTTTPGSVWTAGVIESVIGPGGYGLLTEYGLGRVWLAAARGAGERVGTSATAGKANLIDYNYVAQLLEGGSAGNTVRCWVDTSQLRDPVITLTTSNQQTTLTSPAYVNDLSTTFFLRWGGHVLITTRFLAYYAGAAGGSVILRLALDGVDTEAIFHTGLTSTGSPFYPLYFSTSEIFDRVPAGQHTAGLKWSVNAGGNTGYMISGKVQITVL